MAPDVIQFPGSEDETPSAETVATPTVTDRILAVSGDFRERMEGMADPQAVWTSMNQAINTVANKPQQRNFVRAVLAGLALGLPTDALKIIVEKWQRAVHEQQVGNTGLADQIASILEGADGIRGDYRTASITDAIHWQRVNKGSVPGIQPAGSESVPIPKKVA